MFIFIFPFLHEILRKYGSVLLMGLVILVLPEVFSADMNADTLFKYLPSFCLGMIFAKEEFLEKIRNRIKNGSRYLLMTASSSIVCLLILVFLWHYTREEALIFASEAALVVILSSCFLFHQSILDKGLEILGENSKYMWLIHGYIYTQMIRDCLFGLRNMWLIYIVLVLLSLTGSYFLKKANDLLLYSVKTFRKTGVRGRVR